MQRDALSVEGHKDLRDFVTDAPPSTGTSLRRAFTYCLKVFISVRIVLSLIGLAGIAMIPMNEGLNVSDLRGTPARPGIQNLVTMWDRWDAGWFLRIADKGYATGDGSSAFFPLYPLTVRLVSGLLGDRPLAAGLLISSISFLGGLIVLYLLTELEFSEEMARRTILLLAFFPTALFFFAPYAESLFLFCTVASFYAMRRGRWWVAGLMGGLAAATRSIGIALVLPLGFEAIRQSRQAPRDQRLGPTTYRVASSTLVAVGPAAYLAFWHFKSGDWLAPLRAQGGWLREFSTPWQTVARGSEEAIRGITSYPGGYHLMDWLIVIPMLVVAVRAIRKLSPPYWLYTSASLLLPLSFVFPARPFMSLPRFMVTVFPLFWVITGMVPRRDAYQVVLAASATGLGVFTFLFVNWYWIF